MRFFTLFRPPPPVEQRPGDPTLTRHQKRVRRWDRAITWMTNAFFLALFAFVLLFVSYLAGMVWPVL